MMRGACLDLGRGYSQGTLLNFSTTGPRGSVRVFGHKTTSVLFATAKKFIEISLPWRSSSFPIADRNHVIVRDRLNNFLNPLHLAKPWSPEDPSGTLATTPIILRVILLGHTKIRFFCSGTAVVL